MSEAPYWQPDLHTGRPHSTSLHGASQLLCSPLSGKLSPLTAAHESTLPSEVSQHLDV